MTAFAVDYYPPPTPYDQKSHLASGQQSAQRGLSDDAGSAATDYPLRMATMMAGNDIPTSPPVLRHHRRTCAAGTAEFVKAKCQDLTPFLAGDASRTIPIWRRFRRTPGRTRRA